MPYYATNMIVQHVIRTAKPWGVSGQEILSHVRLSEQESFRPGGMVPSEKMFDALEFAANRSGRPDFGMQLGETIPDGLIAGLAILLSHCKTLGQAADDVGKYFHIVNSAVAIETTTLAHGKKIRFHLLTQGQYELRHVTEMQAVLFRRMGQFLAGGHFAPRIYQLPLAPLSSPQRYEEALGCPVTFDTGECAAFVEQTDVVRPTLVAAPPVGGRVLAAGDHLGRKGAAGCIARCATLRIVKEGLRVRMYVARNIRSCPGS